MSARKKSSRPAPSLSDLKGDEPKHNARMDLYMRGDDPAGHAIRLVLAEKGVGARHVEVNEEAPPQELLKINPYGSLPCLISRDIVLYQLPIILEYLDERYPHPPLMPFDPTQRAHVRLFIREVSSRWYDLCHQAGRGGSRGKSKARKELVEIIVASEELFRDSAFLMGADYGLADCVVAPVLWRLPHLHVRLPEDASALRAYMQRCFHRSNFAGSLTHRERVMGTQ